MWIKVHNPPCINASEGDLVKIYETRPLSKTVHFVVVEVVGQEKDFEIKKERIELSQSVHKKEDNQKENTESAE